MPHHKSHWTLKETKNLFQRKVLFLYEEDQLAGVYFNAQLTEDEVNDALLKIFNKYGRIVDMGERRYIEFSDGSTIDPCFPILPIKVPEGQSIMLQMADGRWETRTREK